MLESIVAITAGVLAASSYIIKRRPAAGDLIEKLVPYQGIIGAIVLFWSIKGVFGLLNGFGMVELGMVLAQFVVGFLLSYGLLSKYVLSRNDEVEDRSIELRAKLVDYQIPAGLALIVLGVLSIFF